MESALEAVERRNFDHFTDAPEMTTAEALASIQASTVSLLEGLRKGGIPVNVDRGVSAGEGFARGIQWKNEQIDQLIKDLSK